MEITLTNNKKNKTMNYKMIECRSCGEDMPELRLTQYGYNFCVTCSETGNKVKAKHGIPVMMGEGDHTWIETVIMDDDQYQQYQRNEHALKNIDKAIQTEMADVDDDKNMYGPVTIKNEDGK